MQVVAVVMALALVASACGGGDGESPSTSEATQSAESAKAMVNEALGRTQAVQDFLLYLDMSAGD